MLFETMGAEFFMTSAHTGTLNVLLLAETTRYTRLIHTLLVSEIDAKVKLSQCERLDEAVLELAGESVDVILLEWGAKAQDLELLYQLQQAAPPIPVVVLLPDHHPDMGRRAIQAGAHDYLPLDELNGHWLEHSLRTAIERSRVYRASLPAEAEGHKGNQLTEARQQIYAEILRETGLLLNSSLELQVVLDRVLENLVRVVPHDTANIMLLSDDQTLRVVRSRGFET